MKNLYRVEPVENIEKDDVYFEVQILSGENWRTCYQHGVALRFKIEKMADKRAEILENMALCKSILITAPI